ncbi:MAG: type II toxin-antitoxin system HicA family toxin [Gammaproteobacteria bacterium]|nr:type II toxin-antitoxin system HicA family toxin [Gammaproteobacteria bacterium]
MKVREVTAMLKADGWFWIRDRGSHRHFKHETKSGLVTVPGKSGDDIHPKTLNSIMKQAGLK